jgi:fibronectin-binding autotransporter adhesin
VAYAAEGTLTGNVFEHNLAGDGGALLINSLALQDNRIVSNTATYHGGGLYLTSYPTLSRNIITGNVSNKGGGLAITGRGNTNPLLINNIIADNRVTALPGKNGWGSAVYLEDASARLLHTTIARNTGGDGSGLYMTSTLQYYGALALTNTIVVSNPIGLKITSGHTATLNGMLWFNSPVTLTAAAMTTVSVQSQYSDDPKFALDGYHILSGSAAIDHGVNAGVTTDIDNQLRPNGLAPDLGADEWNPPLDKHVYLPLVIK